MCRQGLWLYFPVRARHVVTIRGNPSDPMCREGHTPVETSDEMNYYNNSKCTEEINLKTSQCRICHGGCMRPCVIFLFRILS